MKFIFYFLLFLSSLYGQFIEDILKAKYVVVDGRTVEVQKEVVIDAQKLFAGGFGDFTANVKFTEELAYSSFKGKITFLVEEERRVAMAKTFPHLFSNSKTTMIVKNNKGQNVTIETQYLLGPQEYVQGKAQLPLIEGEIDHYVRLAAPESDVKSAYDDFRSMESFYIRTEKPPKNRIIGGRDGKYDGVLQKFNPETQNYESRAFTALGNTGGETFVVHSGSTKTRDGKIVELIGDELSLKKAGTDDYKRLSALKEIIDKNSNAKVAMAYGVGTEAAKEDFLGFLAKNMSELQEGALAEGPILYASPSRLGYGDNYKNFKILLEDKRPELLNIIEFVDFKNPPATLNQGKIYIYETPSLSNQLFRDMIYQSPRNVPVFLGGESSVSEGARLWSGRRSITNAKMMKASAQSIDDGIIYVLKPTAQGGWNQDFVPKDGVKEYVTILDVLSNEEYLKQDKLYQNSLLSSENPLDFIKKLGQSGTESSDIASAKAFVTEYLKIVEADNKEGLIKILSQEGAIDEFNKTTKNLLILGNTYGDEVMRMTDKIAMDPENLIYKIYNPKSSGSMLEQVESLMNGLSETEKEIFKMNVDEIIKGINIDDNPGLIPVFEAYRADSFYHCMTK